MVAPLWPPHGTNLGTLLRTCDAVGACLAVPQQRTVVVLGHERNGIPPDVLALLDQVVEIPMVGTGMSLNVAVAGSLVADRLARML